MAYGLARRELRPRVPLRPGEGDKQHLTSLEGLAALSLDALSSVAYGPEAIVLVLIAAGTGALKATLPVTLVITALLAVLVVSYGQVIAVHPDGGGAYAVAKKDLGPRTSLLAAASLVVDYVLTVTVSLAAGAASLASAFPSLTPHLLELCLGGLAVLTAVNLRGVAESARVLMLPTALFVASVLGVIVLGLVRSHPVAVVGSTEPVQATQTLGLLLLLLAFSAGCSALTGVEAIANGVPTFRKPRVRRAQRTELMLGALPLFAIGVFIGFTISQTGLVRHWRGERPPGWRRRATLNGFGAVLTAVAGVVLLADKFLAGAWVVVITVPLLMLLFARIERYYTEVGEQLGLGEIPPPLRRTGSLVIVPVGEVSRLTQHALSAARALGDEVVALAVHSNPANVRALTERWDRWDPGVRLDVIESPQRSLVQPIVSFVRREAADGRQIAVLIPEVEPRHRRYQILQNQRGLLLAAALRARTDVVVCTIPYRLGL
jgi:hypothetical protein